MRPRCLSERVPAYSFRSGEVTTQLMPEVEHAVVQQCACDRRWQFPLKGARFLFFVPFVRAAIAILPKGYSRTTALSLSASASTAQCRVFFFRSPWVCRQSLTSRLYLYHQICAGVLACSEPEPGFMFPNESDCVQSPNCTRLT